MKHFITILFTISATFASVTLTIESLRLRMSMLQPILDHYIYKEHWRLGLLPRMTLLVLAWV